MKNDDSQIPYAAMLDVVTFGDTYPLQPRRRWYIQVGRSGREVHGSTTIADLGSPFDGRSCSHASLDAHFGLARSQISGCSDLKSHVAWTEWHMQIRWL